MNERAVIGNTDCSIIASNLPDVEEVFDVQWTNATDFLEFGDAVYKQGKQIDEFPYMYGSYQVYEMDTER